MKIMLTPQERLRVRDLLRRAGVHDVDPETWVQENSAELLDQAERLVGNPMVTALLGQLVKF